MESVNTPVSCGSSVCMSWGNVVKLGIHLYKMNVLWLGLLEDGVGMVHSVYYFTVCTP